MTDTASASGAHTLELVRDYYGKVLASSKDLKTSACCIAERLPPAISEIVAMVHPEQTAVSVPIAIRGRPGSLLITSHPNDEMDNLQRHTGKPGKHDKGSNADHGDRQPKVVP